MTTYEEIIRTIVCPYIVHCDQLRVGVKEFAHCHHVTLMVHRADHSKVVGSQGRMVKALSLLIVMAGQRMKHAVHFELLEPMVGGREPEPPFLAAAWDREQDVALGEKLKPIVELVVGDVPLLLNSDARSTYVAFLKPVEEHVIGAFGTVFRAIGKTMGREILLNAREAT